DGAGAHHLRRLLTDLLLHLPEAGEDLLAPAEEPLTGRGGSDLTGAPAEELLLVPVLQRPDLLAHRGLGDVVELRRAGERPRLHHVAEHLERLELHEAPSSDCPRALARVPGLRNPYCSQKLSAAAHPGARPSGAAVRCQRPSAHTARAVE